MRVSAAGSTSSRRETEHDQLRGRFDECIDVRRDRLRLAVENERDESVQRGPQPDRHDRRIPLLHETRHLELLEPRLHEAKRRAACARELGEVSGVRHLRAEHDAIQRGVGLGEPYVGERDSLEALATATLRHRLTHRAVQLTKAVRRDRSHQGTTIGEVAVRRRLSHPRRAGHGAKGESFEAFRAKDFDRVFQKRRAKIPVMIGPIL